MRQASSNSSSSSWGRASWAGPLRRSPRRPRLGSCRRRGFTLIEAALTTVIVGTGVLAIVAAQQAYHRKNAWAQRTNTAMLLANEIREMSVFMPLHDPNPPIGERENLGPESNEITGGEPNVKKFDDLDDFAAELSPDLSEGGITFGGGKDGALPGPINALREPIPDMRGWSQQVRVESILPSNIGTTYALQLGSTSLMRMTVKVFYKGPHDAQPSEITTLTWVTPGD